MAQSQELVVRGVVRAPAGIPIEGARVRMTPGRAGTITGANGEFRLVAVGRGPSDSLRVERVGFAPRTLPIPSMDSVVTIDVELADVAIALDEMLVTATAGTQSRRAQSAALTTVPLAQITERFPTATLLEAIQGRVTGMDLTPSSGSSGEAQRLWLRGGTSIALSNEPLVFIDGVRADSRIHRLSFNVGGQASSRLFDIEPSDVDRVEVVKGPAAATIYGADAAAGVVHIFTKSGLAGGRNYSHQLAVTSSIIEPAFSAPANFARCTDSDVEPASTVVLCRGRAAGTVVSDNPLRRYDVLRLGHERSVRWSMRSSGPTTGLFAAVGGSSENGTLPQNGFDRRTARIKSRWQATPTMTADVSLALAESRTALPANGDNPDGVLAAGLLGNPRTVGSRSDGALGTPIPALITIEQVHRVQRVTPTLQINHGASSRLHHRLIAGADASRDRGRFFVPVRFDSAFTGSFAGGIVSENQTTYELRTVDYLATARLLEHAGLGVSLVTSVGTQYVESVDAKVSATGRGLVSNVANRVSDAADRTGAQSLLRTRSHGAFAHAEVGWRDRAFLQIAARADRHSAFGSRAGLQVFPKVGLSVVVREANRYAAPGSWLEMLRLRSAYGTSGRSPAQGEAGTTYRAAPVLSGPTTIIQGLRPASQGNPRLRPERASELEIGADAAFLGDRIGVEATYFDKQTRDLLFRIPQPPSSGFPEDPLGNIGGIRNRGLELSIGSSGRLARHTIDAELNVTFLENELTDLGDVQPFNAWTVARFEKGRPLGALYDYRVMAVDVSTSRAIVTDTPVFVGNSMPNRLAALGASMEVARGIRTHIQIDGKWGYYMHNLDADGRDRLFRNSERSIRSESLRYEERLRRFGPFFTQSGQAVSDAAVRGPYLQDASFVRWRGASLVLDLPARWSRVIRSRSASFTLAAHNLHLWTSYEGDPEIVSYVSENALGGPLQYGQPGVLTMPQSRRWSTRLSLWF